MINKFKIHEENWFFKTYLFSHFDIFNENLNIFIIKLDIILISE